MAFGPFERMVAARYLRAKRKEGFVSVVVGFSFLGIALGVAVLIIVMAVMNGFRQDIMDRFLGINDHIEVSSPPALTDYDALAQRIRALEGVIEVTPIVESQVLITSDRGTGGAIVRGIPVEDLKQKRKILDSILEGSLDTVEKGEGILVGNRIAERFRVRAGDTLNLISPRGTPTAFGTVHAPHSFPVAGFFSVGDNAFDAGVIYMRLDLAQTFFRYRDRVTKLTVRVADLRQAQAIATRIEGLAPGLKVYSWEHLNRSLFSALKVERNVMFLILGLVILVAAFNIIAGLIMMVKDKGRDIAILRTMGATRGMMMRVFLLAGTSVGVVGTALGFLLGVAVCDNMDAIRHALERLAGTQFFSPMVNFLAQMPVMREWDETLSVVAMSLVLSLGATLYPSWRAARTDPIEALRYE